jgi:uncharacterized protein YjiS (DUF1127 family)
MSQSAARETGHASCDAGIGRRLLPSWIRMTVGWLDHRCLLQDLSALDDRLLDDVGISRDDALGKAVKSFPRPRSASPGYGRFTGLFDEKF